MSKQPTFVTLTKLQNREPTLLQTAIDNTCGKLNVALKSFHYEAGYHNVDLPTGFTIVDESAVDPSLLDCMEGCIPLNRYRASL